MIVKTGKNKLLNNEKKSYIFSYAKRIVYVSEYLLGLIFILGLHYFAQVRDYPYDAGVYWYEGATYGLEEFSLFNYSYPLRGYLFPLFMYAIRKLAFEGLGTERKIFCIVTSLLYSFFFMILIPKIIYFLFGIVIPKWGRLIYSIICTVMFRGMILYPLTDLFGILLVCIAICFFLILMQNNIKAKWIQVLCAVCMGMSLGGAYYVRPVYLIAWIAFIGIAFISMIRTGKWILSFAIFGMLIVAMPQMCINRVQFNTWSPMIQTQVDLGESLYLSQLEWGIYMQKYETNIDDTAEDISEGMVFEDSVGAAILENYGEIDSYFSYIVFCIKHFADMTCIYLKHIFNGLDIVYPNIYIKKIYCNRFIIQFLNYTLFFIGLEGLVFFIKKKCWNYLTIGMTVTYCLPIILVIPTAVETRFFVGAHIVIYLFAVAALMNQDWRSKVWKCKWKKMGIYIMFLGICFLLNSQTFNCYGIPLW